MDSFDNVTRVDTYLANLKFLRFSNVKQMAMIARIFLGLGMRLEQLLDS